MLIFLVLCRTISSTKMNEASSRSHAIFTMVVETEETVGTRKTFSAGKINLVDLAGSERLYKVRQADCFKMNEDISEGFEVLSYFVETR